ncbi:hypothetical protein [Mesorhizobium sp. NPDC059025]|uniref:hypothetical protein n=1 Tax=unclassified Mesorhizobium TaxID=325217 RepID=UPI0036799A30
MSAMKAQSCHPPSIDHRCKLGQPDSSVEGHARVIVQRLPAGFERLLPMSRNLKTAIIGIIVALIAGLAVNYGLISQQTADEIKAKTDEVLTNEQTAQPEGTQQPAPQAPKPPSAEPSQTPPSTGSQEQPQPSPVN